MPKIIWTDNLSVKIAAIDAQHRKLIDLINELNDAMSQGKGKDVLGRVLTSLIDYTKTHFAEEERLMSLHKYPGYAEHKAAHDSLTAQVIEISEKFKSGQIGLTIPVSDFLKEWLTDHILHTDKEYSAFLISKGVR